MADLRHAVITAKMTIVITRRSEMAGFLSLRRFSFKSFAIGAAEVRGGGDRLNDRMKGGGHISKTALIRGGIES